MLYTTVKEILDNSPCSLKKVEKLKAFIGYEANGFTETTPIPLSAVLKSNGIRDICWVLKLTEQGQHLLKRYSLWNAEKVLPIWGKEYPNDNVICLTIEAARKAIEDPTEENKIAARAFADLDRARSTPAFADFDYARAAAVSCAAAAALFASFATDAAFDAFAASAYAAEFKKEQEEELLRLLEEAS